MSSSMDAKKLYYQQVIVIWEGFCLLHKELYDLTCEEYLTLLASDIDKLEGMLPIKEEIISRIGELEKDRGELVERLNEAALFTSPIERVGDLLGAFSEIDEAAAIPALKNLNSLLINIIENIQDQNKKNQLFLNKAMRSLKDIKQSFTGKKTYTTYGADGMTRTLSR